ncbi:hypothetical protein SLUN_04790 [Streptomyces lunaelactis]|uniref:Uncharacterized protein n=1 Tax=Streptomyces lunaelactis TaxID=1535768 RepID=A0A2R4SXM3_9ACTN|nr:hypothetical protein [Streptomyces lunaelactis]AVZ71608.1 hypothetical protein SLUN_04790 [Streptomyces lunaelactis]NUK89212.1 hypothetical protein [Streptomyces lunaelactis]NUL07439.1 hypothetical protein [Streptomyces lunaelactis]
MGYGSDNNTPSVTNDPPGTSDNVTPPSPAWTGDPSISEGLGGVLYNPFDVPAVPSNGADDSNGTSIHTPSMDLFANNVDQLIKPVNDAAAALGGISIDSGSFYHANKIREDISGLNGDAGLKVKFIQALGALTTGLTELRDGMRTLSANYATTEDANNMDARDFQDALSSAVDSFNTVMTSQGGEGNVSIDTGSTTTTTAA